MVCPTMSDSSATANPPRRATIKDVAKAAGVSPTTVSHALNGKGYVDEKTRERVLAAVKALDYRPNMRAQRLRTGEARTIALISSMPFGVAGGPSRLGFLMEVAAVAAGAALTRGLALVLVPPSAEGRLPLEQLDIDGAIVIEPAEDDATVRHLTERGLPVVSLGRQPGHAEIPFVELHSATTTALLLDHLCEQGSRHIALLIGTQRRNSYLEAEQAYHAFCTRHGMAEQVVKAAEEGGEEGGYEACLALLRAHPELDAICAPVDAFAVGAVRAAGELGRRVPEQLRIVTRYDGIRARSCQPPLTAVDLHLEQLASQCVELLFAHLGGKQGGPLPAAPLPQLLPRASSL
jgi:DNA-binding LacI/PurR family transcriptional regulator